LAAPPQLRAVVRHLPLLLPHSEAAVVPPIPLGRLQAAVVPHLPPFLSLPTAAQAALLILLGSLLRSATKLPTFPKQTQTIVEMK